MGDRAAWGGACMVGVHGGRAWAVRSDSIHAAGLCRPSAPTGGLMLGPTWSKVILPLDWPP